MELKLKNAYCNKIINNLKRSLFLILFNIIY